LSTVFRAAKESADAQFYPHWNPFPRQILKPPLVATVNAPRFLPAHWAITRLARRSQHHNEPTVALNSQLIQHHFTGIRHQCSLSHRFLPETTRALPLFYPASSTSKSAKCGSPNVTKNPKVAGFEVTTSGRFLGDHRGLSHRHDRSGDWFAKFVVLVAVPKRTEELSLVTRSAEKFDVTNE
jgi:hypothetical protein